MDDCFICIEDASSDVLTECCKKRIHVTCIYELLLNGYRQCPMCRKDMDPCILIKRNTFTEYISTLSKLDKERYEVEINAVLLALSKTTINVFRFTFTYYSPQMCWYLFASTIMQQLRNLFAVLIIYVCLFLMLWVVSSMQNAKHHTNHTNTSMGLGQTIII